MKDTISPIIFDCAEYIEPNTNRKRMLPYCVFSRIEYTISLYASHKNKNNKLFLLHYDLNPIIDMEHITITEHHILDYRYF